MKKITMLFALAVIFFPTSCVKSNLTPIPLADKTGSISSSYEVLASVTDTLVPKNAVNALKFGVTGDGRTDDTRDLQALIDKYDSILLPGGVYVINRTLNMRSGVTIYGTKGATIKAGNRMQGTLLKNGYYFKFFKVNKSGLLNIIFQPSDRNFSLGDWANACIYLSNSQLNVIKYNKFEFKQPFKPIGMEAVWITGPLSSNNTVSYNTINTMGLEYAEDGASYNVITYNKITYAHSDALSAHGNGATFCSSNKVCYNVVTHAGHMGIEDWGNCNGTVIRNNIISGTGKSLLENSDGIGISAVGVNELVSSNTITDAQLYYIEIGGNHDCKIDSNIINDVSGDAIGIILNYTAMPPAGTSTFSATASFNVINNCKIGVSIFGNFVLNAVVSNNYFSNPKFKGIDIDSDYPDYNVTISNNTINYTEPNINARSAVASYTHILSSNAVQNLKVTDNIITYSLSANGGVGREIGFCLGTNNAVYNQNKVLGNNIKAAGNRVLAFTANGQKIKGITITKNAVTGADLDFNNLTGTIAP